MSIVASDKSVVKDLGKAINLLNDAEGMGLSPMLAASGRACVEFYMGYLSLQLYPTAYGLEVWKRDTHSSHAGRNRLKETQFP